MRDISQTHVISQKNDAICIIFFFCDKFLCFGKFSILSRKSDLKKIFIKKKISPNLVKIWAENRCYLAQKRYIKSYVQILIIKIRRFEVYFPPGKRLVIDVKCEINDGKEVSAPQKRGEGFHCDGWVTCSVTFFMCINHIYMYLLIYTVKFCHEFFYFLLSDFFFYLMY